MIHTYGQEIIVASQSNLILFSLPTPPRPFPLFPAFLFSLTPLPSSFLFLFPLLSSVEPMFICFGLINSFSGRAAAPPIAFSRALKCGNEVQ